MINAIEILGAPICPADIAEVIEDALERRAEREADRIKVEVAEGTVTLIGPVHSIAEKRAILGAVSHAPGVKAVAQHLYVDPVF